MARGGRRRGIHPSWPRLGNIDALPQKHFSVCVASLCLGGGEGTGSGWLCAKLSGGVSGKFLSILYVLRGQRLIAGSCVHRGALCVLLFTDL